MALSMRQIAALPYTTADDGSMQILLITSRDTRRWVIPKGNRIKGLAGHRAAELEAYEEAGIHGIACPAPLGRYRYDKRKRSGQAREATVEVFPLAVTGHLTQWPEKGQRELRWFPIGEAAQAVDEPDLQSLIAAFREPPRDPGLFFRLLLRIRDWQHERTGMLRWFHALMPKQGRFFEQFEDHSTTLVAGADALARLLKGGPDMAEHIKTISDREHEADDIIRDVLQDVRRIFVTPFDRSAITGLIGVMDDAIDQMNQTAKAIALYEVKEFAPQMQDMSALIVECARITAEAMPLLRSLNLNATRLHDLTERLVKLEGHADILHEAGLKALFQQAQAGNPMDFIVGNEIYSHLEKVTDRFEDVANEISGLVIDHA
jgi:predicted phosphate transport protein (TIGR00153 family)